MNSISFLDIVDVLKRYTGRYKWIDVFTHQVRELGNAAGELKFYHRGEDVYRVQIGSQPLDIKVYRGKGVIRCSLAGAGQQTEGGPAVAGAAIGSLIGAAAKSTGPAGFIFGLLLGGLVGNAIGKQADENRVMTLRYEPATGQWLIYHGPYVQWAKEALRPE